MQAVHNPPRFYGPKDDLEARRIMQEARELSDKELEAGGRLAQAFETKRSNESGCRDRPQVRLSQW